MVGRIVFYLCSLFSSQARRGEDYTRLNRAVSIIITGFRFTEEESFANYYTLRNDRTFTQFSDIIQVCTLELPKLKATDTGALSDWMRFLTSEDERELEALAAKDAGIGKAVEMLKYLSEEETLHFLEMSHEKYLYDIAATRKAALAEGEVRGEARGHHEGTMQVARAALSEGVPVDFIERITGLDAEAIRKLQEN